MAKIIIVLLIAIISLLKCCTSIKEQPESKLIRDLLTNANKSNYSRFSRPVEMISSQINVSITISLIDFISYDEIHGRAKFFSRITILWKDPYFTWSPIEYQGLNKTRISLDEHWHPSIDFGFIHLGNRASAGGINKLILDSSYPSLLESDGMISRSIQTEIDIICQKSNTATFPHEIHHCDIVVDSLVYQNNEVNYNLTVTFDTTIGNLFAPGWEIVNLEMLNTFFKIFRTVLPMSRTKILIQRQGSSLSKLFRLVYPFTCFIMPFLFYIHATHIERIVLSFLLISLEIIQILHLTSLPAIVLENNKESLPSIIFLWLFLILFSFAQFFWFVKSYHLSAQLPVDRNPSPICKRLFLNNRFFGYFIQDYPRRFPATPRTSYGYQRGFENPLDGTITSTSIRSSSNNENRLVFNENSTEQMDQQQQQYDDNNSNQEINSHDEPVVRTIQSINKNNNQETIILYSDWQLICLAIDNFFFVVAFLMSMLFNFLFLLES